MHRVARQHRDRRSPDHPVRRRFELHLVISVLVPHFLGSGRQLLPSCLSHSVVGCVLVNVLSSSERVVVVVGHVCFIGRL